MTSATNSGPAAAGAGSPAAMVPAPAAGLGSNSNYTLYNDCRPLLDISVTIDVTDTIVCASSSGPTSGFGFQLNGYSPKNEKTAWQQYVVAVFATEIVGAVNNWPVSGASLFDHSFNLGTTAGNELAAGTRITITLQNQPDGTVTGATYGIVDGSGKTLAHVPLSLTSIAGVDASEMSPVVAIEVNLVGPANSESAVLSSGGGTITYASSNGMTPLNGVPSCAESSYVTAETADSFYGELPAQANKMFSQSFYTDKAKAMVNKPGSPRPGAIVRRGGK